MDAFQVDILRRLDDLQDRLDRVEQRTRAIALALQQERREAAARARAPVPPPAPEPPPRAESLPARILASGWPGVAVLAIVAAPWLAGVLIWLLWATGTPLPVLIALFGAPHAADTRP